MAQFNRSCYALGKTAFGWSGSGMRWTLVVVLMLLVSWNGFGATYSSVQTGNWGDDNTWSGTGIPGAGDDVIINHVVNANLACICTNLTINSGGILQLKTTNFTNSGLLTINSGGILQDDNGAGTNSFNLITINNSAIVNLSLTTISSRNRLNANITNNSTSVDFGAARAYNHIELAGSGSMDFLNLDFNFGRTITNRTTVLIKNQLNGTNQAGAIWINEGTLNYQGSNVPMDNGILVASSPGNIVNYSGSVNQIVKDVTYYRLITSNSGIKSLQGLTTTTVSENLYINDVSELSLNTRGITVSGTTSIDGKISDNSAIGTNIFGGKITVNVTGAWEFSGNIPVEIQSGITNNGTFTSGLGTYYFTTNTTQNLEGNQTIRFDGNVDIDANVQLINLNTNPISGLTIVGSISDVSSSILENRTIFTYLNSAMPMPTGTLDADFVNNTVIYQSNNAQSIAAGGFPYHNLVLTTFGGSSIKDLGSDLYVNGNLQIDDNATLKTNGFYIDIKGDLDDNNTITDGINEGTGIVIFSGTTGTQTVSSDAVSGFILNDIEINNTGSGVNLSGSDMQIKGNLTFTNGKLDIQGTNLEVIGNIIDADASKYVVANNAGELKQTLGSMTYPVGTGSSYLPIIINNSGTSDVYGVRIISDVHSNGTSGGSITEIEECVKMTWVVTELVAGGSNLNVTVQWNGSDEGTSFDRSDCAIGYYNGVEWEANNSGSAGVSGSSYTQALTGIDGVGAFSVGGPNTRLGDNTAPTFTAPADKTIYTDADCNYDITVGKTGDVTDEADNCSTGIQATFSDAAPVAIVGCEGGYTITRTWSLEDNCGNAAADQTQIITIRDNTAPTFTAPADKTIYKDADCNYDITVSNTGDVTDEADNCSTSIQATFTDMITDGSCEGSKIITRTWHLLDNCGNAAVDQVQTITLRDTIKPTFTVPASDTICRDTDCNYNIDPSITGDVVDENDNCSIGIEATYNDDLTNLVSCDNAGYIIRTWSLSDDCGNKTEKTQIIWVEPTARLSSVTPKRDTICNGDQVSITLTSPTVPIHPVKLRYVTQIPYGVTVSPATGSNLDNGTILTNPITNTTDTAKLVRFIITPYTTTTLGGSEKCTGINDTAYVWIEPTPKVASSVSSDTICDGALTDIKLTSISVPTHPVRFKYTSVADNPTEVSGNSSSTGLLNNAVISETLDNLSDSKQKVVYTITPYTVDNLGNEKCIGTALIVDVWLEPTFRYIIAPMDTLICNENSISFNISSPTNALGDLVFDFKTESSGRKISGIQASDPKLSLLGFSNTLINDSVNYQTVKYSFEPRIYSGNSLICKNGRDTAITIYVNPTPQMTVDLNVNRDSICYKEGTTFIIQSPNQDVKGTMKYNLSVTYDLGDISNVAANQDYTMGNLDQSNLINNSTEIKELTYTFTPFIDDYHPGLDCGGEPVVVKLTIVPEIKYDLWKKEFIGGKNIRCFDEENGVVRVIDLSGGAEGYKYAWTSGSSVLDSALDLRAGQDYTVTVTDKIGCTRDSIFKLTQPDELLPNVDSIVAVKCEGGNTGAIYMSPSGGIVGSGYKYKWTTPTGFNEANEDIVNLYSSHYWLTITDVNGCIFKNNSSYHVGTPEPIQWGPNKTNVSCFGRNDGAFDVKTVKGQYKWTGPEGFTADTTLIENLKPGLYQLEVKDIMGCVKIFTETINQPDLLALNPSIPVYDNGFNIQCEGDANGRISLSPTGGHGNYQYTWLTADGDTIIPGVSSQTQLKAGTYEVKVYDGICRDSSKITLTQPPALNVSSSIPAYNGYEVSCNQGNNGLIDLDVSGGASPYSYQWSTANGKGLVEGAEDQTALGAGNYNLTVTYSGVCSKPYSFTLREPGALILADSTKSDAACFGGADGSIWAVAMGGVSTQPYTYSWSTANGSGVDPNKQAQSRLTAGTYTLVVTDNNNCKLSKEFQLTQPDSIHVEFNAIPISCSDGSDGSIEAIVSGGTPAYSYAWSNGAGVPKLIKVPIGNYHVTVTDINGCRSYRSVALSAPSPLLVTPNILSNYSGLPISCFGAADGAVQLDVSGGTSPYQYAWSTGASTQTISNMAAGNYKVTVYDNYGCTGAVDFTLNQPEKTAIDWSVVNNVCYGEAKGKIDVTAQGGVKPYNFFWSDSIIGAYRTQLLSGTYTLYFSDANKCAISQSITIDEPEKLDVDKTLLNPYCPDATDGEIVLNANGGMWPYQYAWHNGGINPHLTLVQPGIYIYTVTDANNCILRDTIDFKPKYPACLDIPNAFSPNGDEKNPTWVIWAGDPNNQRDLGEMYPNAIVEVVNRWGELVFRSESGYPEPWDGKLRGRELPLDSYFYIVDLKNGSKPVTGIVTIVK